MGFICFKNWVLKFKVLMLIVVSLLYVNEINAATVKTELGTKTNEIRVGLFVSPYFVTKTNNKFDGIAVRLFKKIARANDWHYKFIVLKSNMNDSLKLIGQNEVDIVLGPISVNYKRMKDFNFTRPFYINKVALVITKKPNSITSTLHKISQKISFKIIAIFFIVLITFAIIIWFLERRYNNSEIIENKLKGITLSGWFLLVQFLRGGYSFSVRHKAPLARVLLVLWLMFSLIIMMLFSSLLTAFMTSGLIVRQADIESDNQLHGKPLGYVAGTSNKDNIIRVKATPKKFDNIESALTDLNSKNTNLYGVTSDILRLKDLLSTGNYKNIMLSHYLFAHDEFAFALPYNSPLTRKLNTSIIKMQDHNEIYHLCRRFLSDKDAAGCQL